MSRLTITLVRQIRIRITRQRGILLRKTDLQNAVSFMLLTVHPVLRMKKQII